jgi:hypothetical protein
MSIHDIKVEAAFGFSIFDTSPTYVDISAYVRDGFTDRKRASLEGRFSTGVGQLRLDNRDGRFNPENTSSAYFPDVQIGTPIRITEGAAVEPIFEGSARAWIPSYSAADSEVYVPLADGFYNLNLEELHDESYSAQKTNGRISAVLNDISWPAAKRDIDTGVASVQAISFAEPEDGGEHPALSHLLDVAEAEVGVLFMSRDGKVTFRNRVAQSGASAGYTLDDDNIHALVLTYDDDYFFNDIRVAREDGAQVQVVNASSVSDHGRRVLTKDVMPMANDAQVLNVAEWLSELFGEQRLRIESLVVKMTDRQAHYPDVLGTELRDYINVTHVTSFGNTINQECAVEGIRHEWQRRGNWRCTLRVAPLATLETQDYWILGTSELGVSTRLA